MHRFRATFNIDGKPHEHKMTYDNNDIVATLQRRLKTAFPNATEIRIVQDEEQLPLTKAK